VRIKIEVVLPYDNEIQFFDCCKAISDCVLQLAEKAIEDGDIEQFDGLRQSIFTVAEGESVGFIRVKGWTL
jgi:hypothetical protein